jgi:SAM-dependent methyltransferase
VRDGEASRTLTGLLARLTSGGRRAPGAADLEGDGLFPTRALRRFVHTLQGKPAPAVIDLGPACGTNVSYLGEHLGCKIFVEDLFTDVERLVRARQADKLAQYLASRFPHGDGTVDGALCWDLIDYLPEPASRVLASQLTRLMRPGGVLLALFATVPRVNGYRTDYVIADDEHLRHRRRPTPLPSQPALLTHDIERLFQGLLVDACFLLVRHQQEFLFRKPPERRPWHGQSSRS